MTLKELRIKIGLSQEECAKYLGISRRSYQNYETDDDKANSIKYDLYVNKLEERSMMLSDPYTVSHDGLYYSNILINDELKKHINDVKNLKKRNGFNELKDYVYGNSFCKVFILYGLRRTGKSTLMKQVIAEMNEEYLSKTAFIQVNKSTNLAKLNQDLRQLTYKEYKYIFIDEVTKMNDFIDGASLFSDIFAVNGTKIILSGTDSLGFYLAKSEELYGRCVFLHTTFISYKEFEDVLGIKGIDEYIRYGGTMSLSCENYNSSSEFESASSTNEYVDSSIAKNIQHSLKCYQNEGHFRNLWTLYEKNELTGAINRIIEDINHSFTIDVLTKDFVSNDYSISAKNLRNDKENVNTILDSLDRKLIIDRLKDLLEIKNKYEQVININDAHRYEIKEYLEKLDLIKDVDIFAIPELVEKKYRTIFTQPGMRYSQATALINSLMEDQKFDSCLKSDREYVISRIMSEIKGRMLEDIILLETKMTSKEKKIFKLQFDAGEFDMIVFDAKNFTCKIYEVKHSDEIVEEQYKYLIDEEKCIKTEQNFGKIEGKYVLYRGKNKKLDNGIEYINVEEYLKNL